MNLHPKSANCQNNNRVFKKITGNEFFLWIIRETLRTVNCTKVKAIGDVTRTLIRQLNGGRKVKKMSNMPTLICEINPVAKIAPDTCSKE